MSATIPLSHMFRVRARFCRSVNISADYHNASALNDYIVTPLGRDVLRRVAEGLRPGSRNRAWSITGPYGAGKSACALFTAKVLGYPINSDARGLLSASDPGLYEDLLDQMPGLADGGFFLVLSVGSRQPLSLAVLDGLVHALAAWQTQGAAIVELRCDLDRLIEMAGRGDDLSPDAIIGVVERTARVIRDGNERALGLLLIMDELGKLLEYAALNPAHGDIFLLQSLAELAARSGDNPIALIAILHQSFDRYADRLSPVQRQEWRKVQGRFEDIAFLESQGELLRLIGAAIERKAPLDGLADVVASEVAQVARLGIAPRDLAFQRLEDALSHCAPLHPTVALVLGRLFRSRLAQNERSLFAFLTSGEPHGLQDYLERELWKNDGYRPFYRVDLLYDYVVSALGSSLYSQAQGKKWAEIDNALDRLPADSSPVEGRLIKTIGLLGLIGDQRYLRASEPVLAYSLADGSTTTEDDVRTALARLCDLGIAIYRRHKEAYGLWEGSDVDLDERFQKGLDQIDRSGSLAALVETYGQLMPYVAKRHLHETGTLRYFVPWVTDFAGLDDALQRPLGDADGAVIFVLANHGTHPLEAFEAARAKTSQLSFPRRDLLFIAIPKDISGLREALEAVQAWEWVANNTPELEGDSIARKELTARQLDSHTRLNYVCSQSFDKASSYAACHWLWQGHVRVFAGAREFSASLSEACDHAYGRAPKVHNELINRRSLSSAAAAARRTLIERMLENPSLYRFGIDSGFPPEVSMYLSVLEHTGLHHPEGPQWVLGPNRRHDPCCIGPLWDAIDEFLTTTESGKRPVSDLFAQLREPPFGIRDGLLPVFLAAALQHWEQEVALFETGTFLPKVDMAAFERLIKAPEQFSLQRYRLHGARRHMLAEYSRLLNQSASSGDAATLLTAVRPILAIAKRLPPFTRVTKTISAEAIAVREALFGAREPHRLLFEDLPRSLGMDPSVVAADAVCTTEFFGLLKNALQDLQNAYGRLLVQVREQIVEAFRLSPDTAPARDGLARRASVLEPYAAELKLRAFLHRAGDHTLSESAWLESLAATFGGKAASQWTDLDLPRFKLALAEVAAQFRKTEEIVLESGLGAVDPLAGRVLRLSVLQASGEESKDVLRILPNEEAAVSAIADMIHRELRRQRVSERLLRPALAELASRLLSRSPRTTDEDNR